MTPRRLACALPLLLAACAGGPSIPVPPMPRIPAPAASLSPGGGRAPTTEIVHELGPRERLNDHASRLADGVARWREVNGGAHMPQSVRDLTLTMAADGSPCFSEVLKDHWFQPYAYSVVNEGAGQFQLASAGPNGRFGDGDDLSVVRGPGDPRTESYGYTPRAGE